MASRSKLQKKWRKTTICVNKIWVIKVKDVFLYHDKAKGVQIRHDTSFISLCYTCDGKEG